MEWNKVFIEPNGTEIYEFWFRKEYGSLIFDKALVSFIRPGIRQHPAPKGTNVGDKVNVRILEIPGGVDPAGPILTSYIAEAVIRKLEIKKIGEMVPEDFEGTSEDASSQEKVLTHLEKIYNKPFDKEDIVTVFRIEYAPN